MSRLDTVLIKTASRCNLDCSYCYVYQGKDTSWKKQPRKMSLDTIDILVKRLLEQSTKQEIGFAIVLHGGEPLLLGKQGMEYLLKSLRDTFDPENYPISIQTNGALLNNDFLDLFSKFRANVSISLDGDKKINDISRLTTKGNSSFDSVIAAIDLLKKHRDYDFLFSGTLSVIQLESSAKDTYDFFKGLDVPSMDFLLQDGNRDRLPKNKYSLTSTEYGQWTADLLDEYLNDSSPVKIPFLDDIIRLSLGGQSFKEGKGSQNFGILIIETDGEIRKNDTLRSSYDGADFFSIRENIKHTSLDKVLNSQEFIDVSDLQKPSSEICISCPDLNVCGGGMPLYRWSDDNGYNNPSVYCADHAFLIRKVKKIVGGV